MAISITNGPFTAASEAVITVEGSDLDLVTVATYAGLDISSSIANQSAGSLDITVPEYISEGMQIGATHDIVLSDGDSDFDTVDNTLAATADVHQSGDVAGYDALENKEDSAFFDEGEDPVEPADSWGYVVYDPENLTGLTVDDAGQWESEDEGEFNVRLLDTTSAEGVDGQYTSLRTVTVAVGDVADGTPTITASTALMVEGEKVPALADDRRDGTFSMSATVSFTGGFDRTGYLFGMIYRPAQVTE